MTLPHKEKLCLSSKILNISSVHTKDKTIMHLQWDLLKRNQLTDTVSRARNQKKQAFQEKKTSKSSQSTSLTLGCTGVGKRSWAWRSKNKINGHVRRLQIWSKNNKLPRWTSIRRAQCMWRKGLKAAVSTWGLKRATILRDGEFTEL